MKPSGNQPAQPQPHKRWLKTAFIASVVVGGIAIYSSSHSTHSGSKLASSSPRFPHFIPKHPSRLFLGKTEDPKALLSASSVALVENQYTLTSSRFGRIDHNSVASNEPCEDRHSENTFQLPGGKNMHIFGVYDGHSGNECSESVRRFLPSYIRQGVSQLSTMTVDAVKASIQRSFESLDNEMLSAALDPSFAHKPEAVTPALAGSVVCVASVIDNDLFIANTGDVRAVMGSSTPKGIVAQALSQDHTAKNEAEVARMIAEHPSEPKEVLLYRNRVLGGLMPTRAFGDASYKWTRDQMENLAKGILNRGYGEQLLKRIRVITKSITPPYVTASPEMFHYKLSDEDKFIILASDGLWDVVSNDEAVQIVSDYRKDSRPDENAASYLIRKGLEKLQSDAVNVRGDVYCARNLAIPPPYSRNYRDDITVTVVFLQNDDAILNHSTSLKISEMNVETAGEKPVRFSDMFDRYVSKL